MRRADYEKSLLAQPSEEQPFAKQAKVLSQQLADLNVVVRVNDCGGYSYFIQDLATKAILIEGLQTHCAHAADYRRIVLAIKEAACPN